MVFGRLLSLKSVVADSQLSCDYRQPWVRRPQFQAPDQRGRKEMRIDPANTAPVEPTISHEIDNITVRHGGCLMHLLVVRQQLLPPALITDEELSVDEVMTAYLVASQKRVQFHRKWCTIRQEANPDGGVNEDDHAAECLIDAAR